MFHRLVVRIRSDIYGQFHFIPRSISSYITDTCMRHCLVDKLDVSDCKQFRLYYTSLAWEVVDPSLWDRVRARSTGPWYLGIVCLGAVFYPLFFMGTAEFSVHDLILYVRLINDTDQAPLSGREIRMFSRTEINVKQFSSKPHRIRHQCRYIRHICRFCVLLRRSHTTQTWIADLDYSSQYCCYVYKMYIIIEWLGGLVDKFCVVGGDLQQKSP